MKEDLIINLLGVALILVGFALITTLLYAIVNENKSDCVYIEFPETDAEVTLRQKFY